MFTRSKWSKKYLQAFGLALISIAILPVSLATAYAANSAGIRACFVSNLVVHEHKYSGWKITNRCEYTIRFSPVMRSSTGEVRGMTHNPMVEAFPGTRVTLSPGGDITLYAGHRVGSWTIAYDGAQRVNH